MSETPIRRKEGAVAEKVETAFTLLLLIFSVFFIWQATEVSEPPRNIVVGPRTFPLLIGGMMLAISVVLLWQRMCARSSKAPGAASEPQLGVVPLEQDETSISDWPAVWSVLGSLLALFLLLETLGFVAALTLFLFCLSTLFAPCRWLLNLGISIGFSTVFYYLFTRILDIPLPNGVLRSLI
jgi:putative tricarboxylic transport membrane protein